MLVVIATIALLVGLLIPAIGKSRARASRINCISQLKQIGLSMRMFSNDNQGNFPWPAPKADGGTMEYADTMEVFRYFLVASNELSSPKVLICPMDNGRTKARDWSSLSNGNVSYFLGLDSDESRPESVLSGDRTLSIGSRAFSGVMTITTNSYPQVLSGVHNGVINIGFGDGSAQQMTEPAIRNWLLFTNKPPLKFAVP
jgi:prepilin-type processing-associated H-X9-DG protein